jgi:hypothetical protein
MHTPSSNFVPERVVLRADTQRNILISDPVSALGLFTPYDLSIEFGSATIEMGRFSLATLRRINAIVPNGGHASITIGSFCESAGNSSILAGGEHQN